MDRPTAEQEIEVWDAAIAAVLEVVNTASRVNGSTIYSVRHDIEKLRKDKPLTVNSENLASALMHEDKVREAFPDTCDGNEQPAFEAWAVKEGYDMQEHPLHYLFLDPKTNAARQGWKAAIRYCRSALGGQVI